MQWFVVFVLVAFAPFAPAACDLGRAALFGFDAGLAAGTAAGWAAGTAGLAPAVGSKCVPARLRFVTLFTTGATSPAPGRPPPTPGDTVTAGAGDGRREVGTAAGGVEFSLMAAGSVDGEPEIAGGAQILAGGAGWREREGLKFPSRGNGGWSAGSLSVPPPNP